MVIVVNYTITKVKNVETEVKYTVTEVRSMSMVNYAVT